MWNFDSKCEISDKNERLVTSLFIWQEHIDPALRGQRMPQGTPIYDAVTLDFPVVLKIGKEKKKSTNGKNIKSNRSS